ncbi:uncharacterized protein F5147DRAFT_766916 [Suillus discolor]|uniref:DUF6533 domain-containing protein n=1 Tax=Suillus discolor TaxID=1912936 RepID=A0A9P7FP49_9AGAM|nr:uncharacterized protein F5147DRAFT_766916 [Suillus discolor]KAG2121051.1 hypothetical protein F5147DRAFT_766916 [Suillus discolor]
MLEPEEYLYALDWNNNISVVAITLLSYDYMLQFEKEVTFVWQRQWSVMTYLYLVVSSTLPKCFMFPISLPYQVRYFGIVLAMICAVWGGLFYIPEAPYVTIVSISYSTETSFAYHQIEIGYGIFVFMQWGFSVYFCLVEVILIWRLYALHNQSKLILYVLLGLLLPIVALYIAVDAFLWSRPSAISVQEIIITPNIKYCTTFFHIGPMHMIYASIPVICYDIFLVVLAITVFRKHLKERKELKMKPNTYVVMIIQYHVIYFVMNLATQIFMATLWARPSTVVLYLVILFKLTAPFIIVPRLIISIWDTHANDNCVHVSTTFEDCVCLTSPPEVEQPED